MSGLEVAGVILGSLPLVISALEHYSNGLSTLQRMVRYQKVFSELHVIFEAAWTTYMVSCERLLTPLAIVDQEFRALIENPSSKQWKDEQLNEKLRVRLGSSYLPYKNATKGLHKKVEKLGKKLQLDENYLPPWVTKVGSNIILDEEERTKFFKSKWIRIKGGIDSDGCSKLVDLILRDIELINTMVKDAAEMEGPRKKRQEQVDSSYWITVRDHALRLFKSFESRWSHPCQCQISHCANLQLDIRKAEYELNSSNVRFRFLFSFEACPGTAGSAPWDWREVEIEPQGYLTSPVSKQSTRTSAVHFAASTTGIHALPPTNIPKPQSQPLPSYLKITDFCYFLKCSPNNITILGYLDDQPWHHHVYGIDSTKTATVARKSTSLKQIISSRNRGDISIKEKRQLALKMALAVLQLHNTPWLDSTWDTDDIQFITDSSGSVPSLFEPSYVSRAFNPQTTSPSINSVRSSGRRLAKNSLIFALGVALIELSYGESLLARALPNELDAQGNETPYTEMLVATRLVKDIRNRELDNYAWAAARCVTCDLGYPFDYSLEDDAFRAKFLEGVVSPLKDDYNEVFGNK